MNTADPFAFCHGVVPLRPRLESWMTGLLSRPERLQQLLAEYDGPLNLHALAPFRRNLEGLKAQVASHDLPFLPLFARKANKCLNFVTEAAAMEAGVDTASHAEVQQCLDAGVPPERLVCTAAVKDARLLGLCAEHGVTVILDNMDEMQALADLCAARDSALPVGIRLAGFTRDGEKMYSRFGFDIDDADTILRAVDTAPGVRLAGLHFHLNGYAAADRIVALSHCLDLLAEARPDGHAGLFIDIGGGIPMAYLDAPEQWDQWHDAHAAALRGQRAPITHRNTPIGRSVADGKVMGRIDSYPVAQSPVQTAWIDQILRAPSAGTTLAGRMRDMGLELRCEPGRSLLDGCGMTVARVEFVKQDTEGAQVVGVQMNRTQSRSGFAEFALDPLLSPLPGVARGDAREGYLAGTYCTESEWLTRRKMAFPHGVQPGDLMVFPNTAGYLMHFLESRSHQFPLAANVFVTQDAATRDPVDLI